MLFSSYTFLFCFLPLFLGVWQLAPKKIIPYALLFFSIIFYAYWGLPFLFIAGATISANYAFSIALKKTDAKKLAHKTIFIAAIIFNLLPLLWFKYSAFLIQNLALLLHQSWLFTPPGLPAGISFYTFIQIAWLVDIYKNNIQPQGLLRHAIFSGCFPYILSGPIVRYTQIGEQFATLSRISTDNLAKGITLFTIGLGKKIILADSIGYYSDAVFNAAQKFWPVSCLEAWCGSLCYTFQLYFDFSGYTDMALGLALMIGLRLPENFNSPYKSTGIVDFWRRWHITLGAWLRDFLYIPLGGNRRGKPRQYLNLFLTMLIGGIWHGAGWTFVLWGAMHGIMLSINHFFRAIIKGRKLEVICSSKMARLLFIIFTFFCLNFCWVVFRAPSLDAALQMYAPMFTIPENMLPLLATGDLATIKSSLFPNNYFTGWQPFALLTICASICWFLPNSRQILYDEPGEWRLIKWQPDKFWAGCLALLAFISIIMLSRQSTFLYFQF